MRDSPRVRGAVGGDLGQPARGDRGRAQGVDRDGRRTRPTPSSASPRASRCRSAGCARPCRSGCARPPTCAPWVTALPPDVGFLPRRESYAVSPHVPRSRSARGDRSAFSATRSRLIDLRRTLWIGPRPGRAERADRPRASHRPLCPPGQSSPRVRATSREAWGVRAGRSASSSGVVGDGTHGKARDPRGRTPRDPRGASPRRSRRGAWPRRGESRRCRRLGGAPDPRDRCPALAHRDGRRRARHDGGQHSGVAAPPGGGSSGAPPSPAGVPVLVVSAEGVVWH